jgi:intracellular multiplication protein IcmL
MDRGIIPPGSSGPPVKEIGYYRTGFRIMMRVVNIQAVIILGLTIALSFYLGTKENHDRYFAETGDGREVPMEGLRLPNMGKMAIANWAALAAGEIMTFGFNDIDTRFAESQKKFTDKGWSDFRKAMIKSGLIDDMLKAQQIVTTVPKSPPILTEEGLINGIYSWKFDIPLLITFRSGGVKTSRPVTVSLVIETISTHDHPDGVGISEWYIS